MPSRQALRASLVASTALALGLIWAERVDASPPPNTVRAGVTTPGGALIEMGRAPVTIDDRDLRARSAEMTEALAVRRARARARARQGCVRRSMKRRCRARGFFRVFYPMLILWYATGALVMIGVMLLRRSQR